MEARRIFGFIGCGNMGGAMAAATRKAVPGRTYC